MPPGGLKELAPGGEPAPSALASLGALRATILAEIGESVSDAVIVTDSEGTVLAWNGSAQRLYGWSAEEAVGRDVVELTTPMPSRLQAIEIMEELRQGRAWSGSFEVSRKDRAPVAVHTTLTPVFTEAGAVCAIAGVSRRLEGAQEETAPDGLAARLRTEETTATGFLAEAGRILASSLDYEESLRQIVRLVVPGLADWCAVHLLDADGELRPVEAAHSDPGKNALARDMLRRYRPGPQSPRGIHAVVQSGEPRLIPELTESLVEAIAHDAAHLAALHHLGMRSAMVVPLTARGRKLGAISFISADPRLRYGPADLTLAAELASRAALAIDHAQLFGEAERARREAQRAADRLRILAEANNLLLAFSLDYDAALRSLAEFAVSRIADCCITYRLDDDGAVRRVGAAHGDPAKTGLMRELVSLSPPRLSDEFGAGAVLRTGLAVLAEEIPVSMLERSAAGPRHLEILMGLAPRSSVVVPLRARGRNLGAMALATTDDSGRRYGPRDLELAQELAARAALVLDNARLYREAQDAVQNRQDLMAVVSHDLRDPLNTIQMAVTLLAEHELPEDLRHRHLQTVTRTIRRMDALISDLLEVSRIDASKLTLDLQPVDAEYLLAEAAALQREQADQKGLSLNVEAPQNPPQVRADLNRVLQVLSNLVGNAIKFTGAGGRILLQVRAEDQLAVFCVRDTGCGIASDDVPRLFQRFWQAEPGKGGSGLGLFIARGIVEAHGGRIWVETAPGQGTAVHFTLPASDG